MNQIGERPRLILIVLAWFSAATFLALVPVVTIWFVLNLIGVI